MALVLAGPCAWIRRRDVPQCVRGWPALIAAGWWGSRRARDPLTAVLRTRAQPWLGWVVVPGPGEWRAVLGRVLEDARRCGGRIVINPEAAWRGASDFDALDLVSELRAGGCTQVWCAAYGLPVAGIPWGAWARSCDGIIAQTLDRHGDNDDDERAYLLEARARYEALGAARVLVSYGGWRTDQQRPKSAQETAAELAVRAPAETVCWVPQWTAPICAALARWSRGASASVPSAMGPALALLGVSLAAIFAARA